MIFRDNDCGAVPILDEGKPVAILTDRDVALAIAEFPDIADQPVSAVMNPGVVAVAPGDSLEKVCELLRTQCVRRTLVVDSSGAVKGIIGWADIATVLSDRMMGRVVKDVVGGGSVSWPAAEAKDRPHPVEVACELFCGKRKTETLALDPEGGANDAERPGEEGDRRRPPGRPSPGPVRVASPGSRRYRPEGSAGRRAP